MTYVLVVMLLGCAIWFSVKTRFVQFRMLGEMIRLLGDSTVKINGHEKHISSFQAFTISLASRCWNRQSGWCGNGPYGRWTRSDFLDVDYLRCWVPAVAFVESTLAQLLKSKENIPMLEDLLITWSVD